MEADRPALTEIEITPEMIEAAVEALSLWDPGENGSLIVASVFSAMLRALEAPLTPMTERAWFTNDEPISDAALALLGYVSPEQRAKDEARLREATGTLRFNTRDRYSLDWGRPGGRRG